MTPEQEIQNRIDRLLNNKKKEPKKFNNNPPKREQPKSSAMHEDVGRVASPPRGQSKERQETTRMSNTQVSMMANLVRKNESQFQSYQVKKMYNAGEASSFGSADTKLKQLQMKLREATESRDGIAKENIALR